MIDTTTINSITDKLANDYLLSPESLTVSFLSHLDTLMADFADEKMDFYKFNEAVMMCTIANKMAMDKAKLMTPLSH